MLGWAGLDVQGEWSLRCSVLSSVIGDSSCLFEKSLGPRLRLLEGGFALAWRHVPGERGQGLRSLVYWFI